LKSWFWLKPRLALSLCASVAGLAVSPCAFAQTATPATAAAAPSQVDQVVVTASTLNLLGVATTSSQGSITKQEIDLRPVYRVGQLLETMPGLTVTVHSGEGKANQYLLRGFNLDHGTDLATFIDGMPVNMRTHTHGQGYTDLNYFVPELAAGVDFTKGPYYASEGDFASVGADHVRLVDTMKPTLSLSAGTVGDQRVFLGGSQDLGGDNHILAAGEVVHLNGPWDHPDNFRKTNLALRWSHGTNEEGYSLTGLYYRGLWNATTDQPERAVAQGLIGRFGTLDPSDGGQSERFSLSGDYAHNAGPWKFKSNLYVIRQQLTLWNDFTHLLDDPVNGDQHAQNDRRTYGGGTGSATYGAMLGKIESDTTVGVQGRYDDIYVDLRHTKQRADLENLRADKVKEASIAGYAENTTYWTGWLRTIVGAREDYYHIDDLSLVGGVSGKEHASMFQPKGSLVLGPWDKTEFYLSAGRGFHSNDGRAGLVEDDAGNTSFVRPPLLVESRGYEVGVRSTLVPHLQAAVTLFQADFDSELTYNADAGQTEAGRPSRRRGVEASLQYRPFRWLELNSNIAITRARYRDIDPAGQHIEDAPSFIGSVGALVDNLGPWFGAVQWRDLGAHALLEDNSVRSPGYREWNLNIGYKINPHLKVQADVFNLTNSKSNAADYLYADRISLAEPADGVLDIHSHPLEPRSARFSVTATF
jgi:hypothetical protein